MEYRKNIWKSFLSLTIVLGISTCVGCSLLEKVIYTDMSEKKEGEAVDQRAIIEETYTNSKNEWIGMMDVKEGADPDAENALYEVGRFCVKDVQYYEHFSDAGIAMDDPRISDEASYQTIEKEGNDAVFIQLKADTDLPVVLIKMEIEAKKWSHPNITPFALSIFNDENIEVGEYVLPVYYDKANLDEKKDFYNLEINSGEKVEVTLGFLVRPDITPPDKLVLIYPSMSIRTIQRFVPLGLPARN